MNREDKLTEKLTSEILCCSKKLHRGKGHGSCHGQGKILRMVSKNPGITQKNVQELMGLRSGTISELVSKLENRGYIIKTRCQDDKRLVCLNLTEEGKRHVQEMNVQKIPEDFFKGLNETEMVQMDNLLTKLMNGWKKE